jgi:peptide/nickel transport system substrate-binding protein
MASSMKCDGMKFALSRRYLSSTIDRRRLLGCGAALASLSGIAPLLAACGGDDDEEAEPTAAETSSGTPAIQPAPTSSAATVPAATVSPSQPTAAATATVAATAGTTVNHGGQLIAARSNDSNTLDPQQTTEGFDIQVFWNIFDPLVAKTPTFEFEPIVAEAYAISEDGLTYTWTIRQGLKFHDGSDLTSESVKFTFDRAIDPDNPMEVGAFIGAYSGSEVIDQYTVVMTLTEPVAPFLGNVATGHLLGILPENTVREAGDNFGINPIGSGPWLFSEWDRGEQITLIPNPNYVNFRSYVENKGSPLADELVFRSIPEIQTQIAALDTGEVNHIALPNDQVVNYEDRDDIQLNHTPGGDIVFIDFAMEKQEGETFEPIYKEPFNDIKLRQAVAFAVNAEEIIENMLGGVGERNFGLIPAGVFAYDPAIEEFGYHFDPEHAAALLDEAGWLRPGDGDVREKDGARLELEFWVGNFPPIPKVAQVIQNQLDAVGFKINLQVLEGGTLDSLLSGEGGDHFHIMSSGWPEPDILYLIAYSLPWGLGYFRPPEYIDLISRARTLNDQDERKRLYFEAQKILLEYAAMVPPWTNVQVDAVRKELKGFKLDVDANPIWSDAWVE